VELDGKALLAYREAAYAGNFMAMRRAAYAPGTVGERGPVTAGLSAPLPAVSAFSPRYSERTRHPPAAKDWLTRS
jgi:hypothetical protein